MYLNFFSLKKEPFNITPDPELLFLSPSHKEALAAVIYGVNQRKGFIAITGEVGVGKTTIIRSFLARVDKQKIRTVYIFNSNISFKALLKTIYQNLGRSPETDDIFMMVNQLHLMLINEYKAGRNVVLVIDEVQNMPVETLENLRMLSNLETSTDKLIQIVLSGQPEFEQRLDLHSLRQLKQRIAIRVRIRPLSGAESLEYINFRLCKSSAKDAHIFTRGALNAIVGKADGIPRIINILCDNCLITTFGNNQKKVTSRVAREIIAEQLGRRSAWGWRVAVAGALFAAVCAFWIYLNNGLNAPGSVPAIADQKPNIPVIERSDNVQPTLDKSAEVKQVTERSDNVQPVLDKPAEVKQVTERSDNVQPVLDKPAEVKQEAETAKPVSEKMEKRKLENRLKNENGQKYRVAHRGDTLAKIVKETYGSVDGKLLKLVKRHNPGITHVDVIREGEKIRMPDKGIVIE